jgi:hypothetical protein
MCAATVAPRCDTRAAGAGKPGGGPVGLAAVECLFYFSNIFQTDLNLNLSKVVLPLLKKFQIKY